MTLRFEDKAQVVSEVNSLANAALSVVLADYSGLTVIQMTQLRKQAREQKVRLRVIRNTLARRAFKDSSHDCLCDNFVGPTLVALSEDELGLPARVLKDFSEENPGLKIRALSVDGIFHEGSEAPRIASLPTREVALGQLMGVMLAPIEKMARTINEVPARLTRTVAAVGDSGQLK